MRSRALAVALVLSAGCAADLGEEGLALLGDGGAGGLDGGVPIAVDDAVETIAGQPVSFSVLANDSDPQGDPLTVSLTGDADWPFSRTTYDCAADGNCTVDAYPHESGTGWFVYRACDPGGHCAQATVTVTIQYIVTQPYAADDEATTGADEPVDIAVLANDNGNGDYFDTYSLAVTAGPFYGTAEVDSWSGSIVYTGGAGYRGSDVLQYFVCNMHGRCTSAWVYVFIDPATAPVVARADSFTVYEGIGRDLTVAGNDSAPFPRIATVLAAPARGTAEQDGDAVWYTSYWGALGDDFLVYALCAGADCAASTARITVRGNSEPIPIDDYLETDEDHPISFDPMANDTDPDGDPLRFGGCDQGEWPWRDATFQCNSESGWCDFTPAPTQTGTGTLVCTVCDELYCSVGFVYINVTRVVNPPECYADAASTAEDTPLDIRVLDNDAFNGGRARPETMTFVGPAHGSAVVDVDTGVVTYTPAADFSGADTFSYNVCDVFDLCCGAQVSLTVTPVADPPAFTADASNSVQRIARSGVPVPLRAIDADGGTLTFARVSGALPDHITLNANGSFTSSGSHKKGTYRSVVRVSDPGGLAATTDLTIIVE
jgi:hypothetical protein